MLTLSTLVSLKPASLCEKNLCPRQPQRMVSNIVHEGYAEAPTDRQLTMKNNRNGLSPHKGVHLSHNSDRKADGWLGLGSLLPFLKG